MADWFHSIFPDGFALVAGPCSAESEAQVMAVANALKPMGVGLFRAGVWKPRTRPGGFEGMGEQALPWLQRVKCETGLRVATEVASAEHVEKALRYDIDVVWLGARTTTNPFTVQEIAEALRGTNVPVMVKNAMVPDVKLWCGAVERLRNAGIEQIAAVHRGFGVIDETTFRNAPIWRIPIEFHRQMPDIPLLCDPSHIAGRADLVGMVAQQAADLDFDGLMIEVHNDPCHALSDSAQQLDPETYRRLIGELNHRKKTIVKDAELAQLRAEIDQHDSELFRLLSERMEIVRKVGELKQREGTPVLQTQRYNQILERRLSEAEALGLSHDFVKRVMELIHEEAVCQQLSKHRE
ncbi:MAG: bifunctional 3-deoxy-7-phosphoheptulonate synthase/chorismate mutase type II [Paludibacteraceae bacterium]|nr:bifunctional 3-deoxy-7-phosphoheptulonate synthase/chorismate mutase type II [Paludibacteraceae bacterium]